MVLVYLIKVSIYLKLLYVNNVIKIIINWFVFLVDDFNNSNNQSYASTSKASSVLKGNSNIQTLFLIKLRLIINYILIILVYKKKLYKLF